MTKKSNMQAETRKNTRAQREDKFDAAIAQFEADIEEAGQIEKPAEKILKLDEIRRNIYTTESEINKACKSAKEEIRAETKRAANKAALISLPTVVIIVGPAITHDIRYASVKKKLEAEAEGHFEKTDDQQKQMSDLRRAIGLAINTVAEDNVTEIALSPLQEQVLDVLGIRSGFAEPQ